MEKKRELLNKIEELKRERDAVILAHYYVNDDVQEAADYIGDSYYLSKLATTVPQNTICFAGVGFMGESARILNPDKTILLPDPSADCPMAHMASREKINRVRAEYDDVAVVCYINSTAELKSFSDVCVTSSNAEKIVSALPNKNIYFIPDEHLGRYIAGKLPDKHFIFNDGFCHVHKQITAEAVKQAKADRPEAKVLVHPECTQAVLAYADYIGSTSGIIEYASVSESSEFIICTEAGVLCELKKRNPDKKFYLADNNQYCPDMKKITLEKIYRCLRDMEPMAKMDESRRNEANKPLTRMLTLAE